MDAGLQVTVLGARGGAGGAITAELARRGHAVTAVTRDGEASVPDGVDRAAADLYDPAQTSRACAGAGVVVLAAHPPYHAWPGNFERLVDSVLAAVGSAGARLVFVDNLYMYAPADGPITERSPEHASGKGGLRRDIARRLLQAHEQGRVPVAIGRFSDYYGPGGDNSLLHGMMFEPALAGKQMRIMVAGDQPHTFHFLRDAARGFATLVEHPEADGRPWVLPAAPAVTQAEMAAIVNDLVPEPVKVSTVTKALLLLGSPFSRQIREGRKVVEQFDRPWVADASAFEEAFGPVEVTDHRSAVAATLAWLRERRA